jgi:NADPH:quinone reductase-like Zn-dependent oxidoreductase
MASSAPSSDPPFPLPNLPTERTACLYGCGRSDGCGGRGGGAPSSPPEYSFSTLPVPLPRSKNEVLVKVVAAGLNPADAKRVVGDKLPPSCNKVRSWFDRFYLRDKIPGFDFAGVVVRTWEEANGDGGGGGDGHDDAEEGSFKVGDAVFGMVPPFVGTLTDYLVAPVDQIARKPQRLDWEQAAALPLVGVTALQALAPLQVKGRSVLVVGASGGTGHVAVQAARRLGARRVVAVCGPSNLEFCLQLGATDAVSYADGPEALVAGLRGCEGACPFDAVLDCVTSDDPRDTSALHYPTLLQGAAAPGADGEDPAPLLAPDYAYRRLGGPSLDWIRAGIEQATGWSGVWRGRPERLFWIRLPGCSEQLEVLRKWADGADASDSTDIHQFQPTVSKTFEFTPEGVRSAMDALMSRRVRGKVVVRMTGEPTGSN